MVVVQPFTEVTSPKLFTVAAAQASDAVGAVNEGVAVHSIVAFAPAVPMVGGVVSTIVIVWLTVALWLPQMSTASQLLVIVVIHPVTDITSTRLLTLGTTHASVAFVVVKFDI